MLIGLAANSGAGKDFAAKLLVPGHHVKLDGKWTDVRYLDPLRDVAGKKFKPIFPRGAQVAFADPMKEWGHDIFKIPVEMLWGPTEARAGTAPQYGIDVRNFLQQLGSEFGRNFAADVWVDRAFERVDYLQNTNYGRIKGGKHVVVEHDAFIVSDVRFQNEADAIKDAGGVVWILKAAKKRLKGAAAQHVSEGLKLKADFTITRNEDPVKFYEQIVELVGMSREFLKTGG